MWKLFCFFVVAPFAFVVTGCSGGSNVDVTMINAIAKIFQPCFTFEQRWEPVQQVDVGIKKGDRLDRQTAPASKPQQRQPTMGPMRIRVACVSFCDYP